MDHSLKEDSPVSTFRPRTRQLFQYRHYRYVMDSRIAAPLTLSMLEEMLKSPRSASRSRAFDLILNLGVHAHLLEPMVTDEAITIEEDYGQEYINHAGQLGAHGTRKTESSKNIGSSAIDKFESWILSILYEILLLLVQIEEKEEYVWASGFSCLLYFICDRGKIWRSRLNGLDIRVSLVPEFFLISLGIIIFCICNYNLLVENVCLGIVYVEELQLGKVTNERVSP